MKRVKPVLTAAVIVRVFPEEHDILRFNAGLHGMSMSEYIRQTCLGIRLRKTPEEKRRLRELARIGANINQLARWANTYKRAADQRNILWVRHPHAGHHELHFLIPRLELSSGKDFNACPPGWQKDFDVFRDLFNWREGWARPDDPARTRDELPKKADLFKARMARWGKEIRESDRDRAKEGIYALLKEKVTQGLVRNREDVLNALKEQGLSISREGRDSISVIAPDSGMKMRFRGGFYARGWTLKVAQDEESEEKKKETERRMVARLQPAFERVIEKRAACNIKRYPAKWKLLSDGEALLLPSFRRIPFMTETEC